MAKSDELTGRRFYWRLLKLAFKGRIIWAEAVTGLLVLFAIPLGAIWWKTEQGTMNWWPLIIFGAVFLGTVVVGLASAPYWLWKEKDDEVKALKAKMRDFEESYAYALALDRIDLEEARATKDGKPTGELVSLSFQLAIRLRNTLSKPIRYDVRRLTIDGREPAAFVNHGGVVPAGSPTTFFSPRVAVDDLGIVNKQREHDVSLEILYGSPDKYFRSLKKNMVVIVFAKSQGTRYMSKTESDTPIVAEGADVAR